jgi:hypothetical protein
MGKMKVNQKAIDILLFAIGSAGLGIVIGIVASSYQNISNGKMSPIPYQNFGIYIGAIVGLSTCLAAFISYLFLTRFILHRRWFNLRLFLLFCFVAGAIISVLTQYLIVSSAGAYGFQERTGNVIVIDGIISAVVGGGLGLLFGLALAKIRNYDGFW